MKVTVTQYLNVRVGAPSLNAPCYQYIAPGSELDVDGQLYTGDTFNGIKTWLKDAGGNYYWSGGVDYQSVQAQGTTTNFQQFLDQSFNGTSLSRIINYGQLLNIDQQLKSRGGTGVTIAIVDHPMGSYLQSNVAIQRPIASTDPKANFHANFIFGIIAGINNIIGISTNVKIISLPIFDELGRGLPNGIEKALEYIETSPDPMIVNISDSFHGNYDSNFSALSKNKIVVAAGGMNNDLTSTLIYPARLPNAISVGAMDANFQPTGSLDPKLNFILPNFNYVSFKDSGNYYADDGDSFAAAVITSVIALMISSGAVGYDQASIIGKLNSLSTSFPDNTGNVSFNLLKP
jgi:hypothetical protein